MPVHATIHYLVADFTRPLDLPPLDGIVMANSLHFTADKGPVLEQVRSYLVPGGRLIVVEYNASQGNRWAYYPADGRFYTRTNTSGQTLYRLTPPADWKNGTWTIDTVTVSGALLPVPS